MRFPSCTQPLIVTFAALIFIASLGAASVARQGGATSGEPEREPFDEFYRRGRETGAAIKTLTANFTETTTSSLLTAPLVARGTLAVERPSRVVMRYSDPEPRFVLIEGDRMTMWWPSRNLRQESDVSSTQDRIQKYIANDSGELRSQFDIELPDESERPGTYEVALIPKRKQIRETTPRLEFWVKTSSMLLSAIRITFTNGDTKTMVFENVAPNVALDPGTFIID